MAEIISRAFRAIEIIDLSDLAKGSVRVIQLTGVSHDGGQDLQELTYEDSIVPSATLRKSLTGNITIKGYMEAHYNPSYAATVRTDPLFELDHYYLIRFLSLNVATGVSEMLYHRWIGQLVELPKETKESGGDVAEKEITLKISIFGNVSYALDAPYCATAGPDPGPADETPTADYNPLFQARVDDTTKTLAAAEALIGTCTNPCADAS